MLHACTDVLGKFWTGAVMHVNQYEMDNAARDETINHPLGNSGSVVSSQSSHLLFETAGKDTRQGAKGERYHQTNCADTKERP
jgi:hypothetical protein